VDHTPVIGGAQLVLATHIAALDKSRFEALVACTDTEPALIERYRAAGARVHVLPMPRLRRRSPRVLSDLLLSARRLRRLAQDERVDLVVANTSRAAYIASVALIGAHAPLIWWVRDFLFGDLAFRLLHCRASRIICVSRAVRDHYAGGGDPRFSVVHVGSSLHDELPAINDDDVRAERARWGFADDDVVVGFMGRLVGEKGPEDVLAATALAHATDSRVKLLVVGSGRGQQGDVEAALRAMASEAPDDCVVFAGFQREQALFYRLFDIFVLATRTPEPYATSVVQAMMARTPVIATATGGTPELVHDGVTGLLVQPCSPPAIAAAIRRLATEPLLRRRVVDTAEAEVMRNNREQVTTCQAEAIYLSALLPRDA
jgi:glycosyltransferase involved in cell wall biosynthesis